MKARVKLIEGVTFVAESGSGHAVVMDASPEVGGRNLGARPMEMVLMGAGGCSAIDVVSILQKQRQPVEGFRVTVEGEREQGKEPSLFTDVHVRFEATGQVDPAKMAEAVRLSMEKYCSVTRILEKTAKVTWSHAVLPSLPPRT